MGTGHSRAQTKAGSPDLGGGESRGCYADRYETSLVSGSRVTSTVLTVGCASQPGHTYCAQCGRRLPTELLEDGLPKTTSYFADAMRND